jgi:hypothetical protein
MSEEWQTLGRPLNPKNRTVWVRSDRIPHIQPLLHSGRIFWQTTTVSLLMLCVAALYICSSVAGYWLKALYQTWYGIMNFFPRCFILNRISIQIWLKAAYCQYNCRHYLLPLCICIFSIGYILSIIYLLYNLFGLLYFCYLITEGGGLGID